MRGSEAQGNASHIRVHELRFFTQAGNVVDRSLIGYDNSRPTRMSGSASKRITPRRRPRGLVTVNGVPHFEQKRALLLRVAAVQLGHVMTQSPGRSSAAALYSVTLATCWRVPCTYRATQAPPPHFPVPVNESHLYL